jgi:hypothetical protein
LFSGDRLSVAPGGYAKIALGSGPKVEVDGNSDVTVATEADAVNITMNSGNIAFSGNGQKPVRVRLRNFEITARGNTRGTVAFVGSEAFGVRVLEGTVSVRNTTSKQSFTVEKGIERLVSLSNSNTPMALLASTSPAAIPAAPAMPQASSPGLKKALIITSLIGSAAAIGVLMSKNDDSDTEAAQRLRRATADQSLSVISSTADAAESAASAVDSAASAASTAINAAATNANFTQAEKNALVARANTLSSAAKASSTSILSLKAQLLNLQNLLSFADASNISQIEQQIQTVLGNVNVEVNKLNSLISQLNSLVDDARNEGLTNVPLPNIQPVQPATPASPSQV